MNRILKTLVCLFALVCTGAVMAAPAPSDADVQKVLAGHFTDTQYATRVYTLNIESVQRGTPRLGNYLTDGTPANKKVEVVPVKSVWVRTTTYRGDPKVVNERFTGEYVFFKDEFGEWTFRLKKQDSVKF